ncbi:unnamed protein product [Dibothriocephalus latus]|uniref:Uncharacterized protein n=1 Tax=Dibothriocephalus latus TaxID=60516 RepID=A0A3P7NTR0_DIBLA|nr:unnamed protein product [Dibothriocephalus latus]
MVDAFWKQQNSAFLRRFRTLVGMALKIRSINDNSAVHCPGNLNLSIMANAPLAEKTLFLEYLSRGVLTQPTTVLKPARSGYACSDGDSDLGHYTCNMGFQPGELGELERLPGWMGAYCLRPHYLNEQVHRTIFMHEAIFEMNSNFGPTLRAVVYDIRVGPTLIHGYEKISDSLYIENLKLCSTPAIFE